MRIEDAVAEIATFWSDGPCPFGRGGGEAALARVEREFGRNLPGDLARYIRDLAPEADLALAAESNAICIFGRAGLERHRELYGRDPEGGALLESWDADWLMIGDQALDPFILDLSEETSPVLIGDHDLAWEEGFANAAWELDEIAEDLGQFLLCASAVHHALTAFGPQMVVLDALLEGEGEAARWLLPRLRRWAGSHAAFYLSTA